MSFASRADSAEEDRSRSAPADPGAVMRPIKVVTRHEPAQAVVQRRPTRAVVAAEDAPPVLSEDRRLPPLNEAVGPGRSRRDAGLANPQGFPGLRELRRA